VLSAIKEDDEFKRIPVVILTTSSADADILRSYNRHANCYITKPINMVEFLKVVTAIQDFWLTIVTLPAMRAAG
jgi:response regulator RpfG family c-di-GMP phosphodiesterase